MIIINKDNMKRVILLFALAMFGFVGIGKAQTSLPGQCKVYYPKNLATKAVIDLTDASAIAKYPYGQTEKPANLKHWVVYSDRDDNVTYKKPDGKEAHDKLKFNEQVRIAKIENGYALVYTEPKAGIEYPKISSEALDMSRGWVPMSKLLLWHSCPADQFGIYQKALICYNLDEMKDGSKRAKLFKSPDDLSIFDQLSTDMKFYYIMKTEGDLALLAHYHTLDGRSNRALYGWVNKNSFVPWNQRSCLEPTWNKEDVAYFVKKDARINFYEDKATTDVAMQIGFALKDEPARYDKYLYRMDAEDLRFPILDDNTENLYNVSTFATINSVGELDMSTTNERARSVAKVDGISENKTNINIGLVIDGTKSMEKYYPAVIEAIKEGCKYFESKYKVQVGAVIYRDYSDGDHKTEVLKLGQPGNPDFYERLMSGNGYGIKSAAADRTNEEALYLGINTALDRLGFKKEQSNILIVVGDCGNDRNDSNFDQEELVAKIVEKDVHLFGFQVRNNTAHQAYSLFNSQMTYLIKSSLERKFANIKSENPISLEMKATNDGFELVNDHNSIIYIGSYSRSSMNSEMDPTKLSNLITRSVAKCAACVKFQIEALSALATTGFANSNIKSNVPKIQEDWLRSLVGEEDFEKLNKSNSLVSFSGYTLRERDGRDFFKPVIFIASDELTALLAKFEPIRDVAAVENLNNREPYVNAVRALAMSVTGKSQDEVNVLGYKEIMRMISGLNVATDALKGYTIEQIANPQSVNNQEYQGLVLDFRRKVDDLYDIKDKKDWKYAIEMNGIKYYWIPAEDMP